LLWVSEWVKKCPSGLPLVENTSMQAQKTSIVIGVKSSYIFVVGVVYSAAKFLSGPVWHVQE